MKRVRPWDSLMCRIFESVVLYIPVLWAYVVFLQIHVMNLKVYSPD